MVQVDQMEETADDLVDAAGAIAGAELDVMAHRSPALAPLRISRQFAAL